jgi:class 3 adenylate cyclase
MVRSEPVTSSKTIGLRALHDAIKAIGACTDRASTGRAAVERLRATLKVADAAVWSLAQGRWQLETGTTALDAELAASHVDVHCVVRRVLAIVDEHGGVVDKLLGDGLLAVFGAPDPRADHAPAAVGAARRMVAAAASISGRPDRRPEPIRIGVGLHSGEVVAGDIGGDAFLDFTVIGSTVNTAARVQEQTKVLGRALLATGVTVDRLASRDRPAWSREVELRGIEGKVRLYALDEHVEQ